MVYSLDISVVVTHRWPRDDDGTSPSVLLCWEVVSEPAVPGLEACNMFACKRKRGRKDNRQAIVTIDGRRRAQLV